MTIYFPPQLFVETHISKSLAKMNWFRDVSAVSSYCLVRVTFTINPYLTNGFAIIFIWVSPLSVLGALGVINFIFRLNFSLQTEYPQM